MTVHIRIILRHICGGDQGTAVDVNANGQWKDMLRYETVSANCPSTRRTVELKAGQIGWKPENV